MTDRYAPPIEGQIYDVDTPGHGGLWVDPLWVAKMPLSLRKESQFYIKGSWFEEDVEWARGAVAVAMYFRAKVVEAAVATLAHYHPDVLEAWRSAGRPEAVVA